MMTVTVSGETETRIRDEAARLGVDATEMAVRLIEGGLSMAGENAATLIQRRRREQAPTDPIELERRRRAVDELLRSLDRHPPSAGGGTGGVDHGV